MEEKIFKLTTSIDNSSKELIKDNKLLINGFKVRLIKRLLSLFAKYNIPFNKSILESTLSDYLIISFRDASSEVVNSYKKLLYKYFDTINEYHNTHRNSKDRIKNVTSLFIKKIYAEDNPILNEQICYNFISEIKLKVLVYDNNDLNKELINRIKSDTNEVIHEIERSNKDYLINSMKIILEYILKEKNNE